MERKKFNLRCTRGALIGSDDLIMVEKDMYCIGRNQNADFCIANVAGISDINTLFRINPYTGEIFAGTHWKSTYGTFINGIFLRKCVNPETYRTDPLTKEFGWHRLSDGDKISFGENGDSLTYQLSSTGLSLGWKLLKEREKNRINNIDTIYCRLNGKLESNGKLTIGQTSAIMRTYRSEKEENPDRTISQDRIRVNIGKNSVITENADDIKSLLSIKIEAAEGRGRIKTVMESVQEASPIREHVLKKKDYSNIELIYGDTIGAGGSANVQLVEDRSDGEKLVLKKFLHMNMTDYKAEERILREANLGCQMSHPNLVKYYRIVNHKGCYQILMEYCDGGSVEELRKKKKGILGLCTATDIILQALDGLEYMHNVDVEQMADDGETYIAKGVIHRDIKPDNLLIKNINGKKVVKIADYGLAKAYEMAGYSNMTRGDAFGTYEFCSSRQASDFRFSFPYVDVFSMAATYYNLLTGKYVRPFETVSYKEKSLLVMDKARVPIRERDSDIPAALAQVIDSVLAEEEKHKDADYTSAAEFKRQIKEALDME